jgi:hypothetical protein
MHARANFHTSRQNCSKTGSCVDFIMPAEAVSTAAAIETAASAVSAQSEGAWRHTANADDDAEDDK